MKILWVHPPEPGLPSKSRTLERDCLCPSQQSSVATVSLDRVEASYPLPHVCAEFFLTLACMGPVHVVTIAVTSYE